MQSDTPRRYGANYFPLTTLSTDCESATIYHSGISFSLGEDEIPAEILAYFRANLRDQFHELILQEFINQKNLDPDLTQAKIARRLNKRPEQINRWLGSSSNLQADTLSDLLLAISASTPVLSAERLRPAAQNSYSGGLDWTFTIPAAGAQTASTGVQTPASGSIASKYITFYVDSVPPVKADVPSQFWMVQTPAPEVAQ